MGSLLNGHFILPKDPRSICVTESGEVDLENELTRSAPSLVGLLPFGLGGSVGSDRPIRANSFLALRIFWAKMC